MKTVLLTLGRLPKALELARALHGAGARVLVADPFERHLTGSSRAVERSFVVTAPAVDPGRYLDELRGIVVRQGVDIVQPVSEEIMHVADLRGTLPSRCALRAMPPAALLAVHDKGRFVEVCTSAGVRAPQTHRLGEREALALVAARDVVVKPVASCSGRGVEFVARGAALPQRAEACVVQQRIDGQLLSTFKISRRLCSIRASPVRCNLGPSGCSSSFIRASPKLKSRCFRAASCAICAVCAPRVTSPGTGVIRGRSSPCHTRRGTSSPWRVDAAPPSARSRCWTSNGLPAIAAVF